jgi:hypothetical protein
MIFNWEPVLHNLSSNSQMKKHHKSKQGIYSHLPFGKEKKVQSALASWCLAHNWSLSRKDGRHASDVIRKFIEFGFDINWKTNLGVSTLQFIVQEALDKDSHLWDEAIKLLIDFGADASYFTQAQKAYIHINCVRGTQKYEMPVVEAPAVALNETLVPKSYPDWQMQIETPVLSDAPAAWAQIKDSFDWEPFFENLLSTADFDALRENEECGIYHQVSGKNAFDLWVNCHQHDLKR